jgi:polyisoprenoid-binding protein YceI
MKRTFAFALAATFVVPALAASETFVIDTNHTKPRFKYDHFGYSTQISRFDSTSGTIVFDAAAQTGSVEVTIDARSVNTGYPVFSGHLRGKDFFDTDQYPTIYFKSTAVRFQGDKPVAVEGNLTIKGISRPVTLTLTSFLHRPHPIAKKDAIGANATARIRRSDFNAGKYAPYVSDEVTLEIPVEAIKE